MHTNNHSMFRWACVWLLVGIVGCGGYGEVSPTAYEYAKALYAITNRKAQDQLANVTHGIQTSLADGRLSDRESGWLIGIVREAEDGNWEASTLKKLRRIPFNNLITINSENVEKVSKAKKRLGLIDVLTLVQQHGHVQDVINASPLTDLRTYNHLLTLVKLGIINIEKNNE